MNEDLVWLIIGNFYLTINMCIQKHQELIISGGLPDHLKHAGYQFYFILSMGYTTILAFIPTLLMKLKKMKLINWNTLFISSTSCLVFWCLC